MIYVDYQKITEVVLPGDNVYLDNKINLSALEIGLNKFHKNHVFNENLLSF